MRLNTPIRWNAYPALLLAGGFALGIWGAAEVLDLTVRSWILGVLTGAVLSGLALFWPRRRLVTLGPLWTALALALTVVALGGARTALYQQTPPGHLGHLLPPRADVPGVALTGRIAGAVERASRGRTRLTLHVDALAHDTDTLAARGKVRVFLRPSRWRPGPAFPTVRQGDRLWLHGHLQAPPERRNPADFDYGASLRRQRIYAVMTVRDPAHIAVLDRGGNAFTRAIASSRAHIDRQIRRYVAGAKPRAVLRALLLGDRSRVSDTIRERFVATGLLHLLAISGLHVLLVGMVLYTLLRPLLMRLRLRWRVIELARALLTLFLLCGFASLTGGRPSVVRAVVMAGFFIGGNVLQRTPPSLNTLGVAALVLLAARPTALFDAGFQLSFAAVGAIAVLNPRICSLLPERWRRDGWRAHLGSLVTVSLAATLGTMPVLLVHFGYVSFAGLVLNVPAIPLTALALLSGLLMVLAGGWLSAGAALLGAAAELLIQGLLFTASVGERWLGWAALEQAVRDPWIVLALVTALLVVAQWPRPRLRWRLAAVGLLFGVVHVWLGAIVNRHPPRLDVVFFDVGQGDAALVAFPSGRHLLIDAGPRSPYFDAAESVILPHLERYGVGRLDAVVISHPDSDHLGGLPTLLRSVPVDRVVLSPQQTDTELFAEVQHLLDSLAVPRHHAHAGDTLLVDSAAYVQVLAPPDPLPAFASSNDASLVLRVAYGNTRFLFTGDVERWAERWIVQHFGPLLRSELIKVSHHGSSTSSTPAFVRHVRSGTADTALAVVSVGRRNSFGLPSRSVLRRWEVQKTTVLATAREGAVWMRSDGERLERIRWR